jgi:hypothetical protein
MKIPDNASRQNVPFFTAVKHLAPRCTALSKLVAERTRFSKPMRETKEPNQRAKKSAKQLRKHNLLAAIITALWSFHVGVFAHLGFPSGTMRQLIRQSLSVYLAALASSS